MSDDDHLSGRAQALTTPAGSPADAGAGRATEGTTPTARCSRPPPAPRVVISRAGHLRLEVGHGPTGWHAHRPVPHWAKTRRTGDIRLAHPGWPSGRPERLPACWARTKSTHERSRSRGPGRRSVSASMPRCPQGGRRVTRCSPVLRTQGSPRTKRTSSPVKNRATTGAARVRPLSAQAHELSEKEGTSDSKFLVPFQYRTKISPSFSIRRT